MSVTPDLPAATSEPEAFARLDLLDHVGCGVWLFDGTDTRYVNLAMEGLSGYTRHELLSPGFFATLIHPAYQEIIVERGRARIRGEAVPEQYEAALISADGRTVHLALSARIIDMPSGRGSLVSAVDITAWKAAELQRAETEARFRGVLDTVPAHVITTSPDGRPTFVNHHWLEYTGLSLEDSMATGTGPLIHPDDVRPAARAWKAAKRTATGYEIDYRIRTAGGDYRWQRWRILPVKDEAGQLLAWTSASLDIDETKQLQVELERANEELKRVNEVKDEVLGLVSHELRTPLTTLIGNANALTRWGTTLAVADREQAVADIRHDAERLQFIIENMLVLARAGADEAPELEPVLLNRVIGGVVRDFRARHPRRVIELDGADSPATVLGNDTYVRQILINLLSNADKYSPAQEPITVTLSIGDGRVVTSVRDRGKGVPESHRDLLFDAFFRSSSNSRQASGMGLGLTVCKRLVEEQHGAISARPAPQTGTIFEVSLPLVDTEDDRQP